MKEKRCSKCRQVKSIKEFALDKRSKKEKRYRAICIACDADHSGADGAAKKKVGVRWQNDPEILFRLDQVATMMNEGAKPYQVAASMGYSWDTAVRDMERVRELWRQAVKQDLADKRGEAIAEYKHTILLSMQQYRLSGDPKNKLGFLRTVIEAQRQIDLIQGVHAPKEIKVGIDLPEEAQRALEALEGMGIPKEALINEFVGFIMEAAEEQKKIKLLEQVGGR